MGLGTQKRRSKLSHDPNNTAWTRDTETFGHKILSRQGWEPGSYLGAKDASHAEHYTAANASHIRVLFREENLGLGAQVGKSGAETFGLSLFSGVLGRLNGKSEVEVEKQQNALRDMELRAYQEKKHGMIGFVRGGFLVGDRIEKTLDAASTNTDTASKKRKTLEDGAAVDSTRRGGKKQKKDSTSGVTQESKEDAAVGRKSKKQKEKSSQKIEVEDQHVDESRTRAPGNESERAVRKRERREKRARKEERRKRKEEKAARSRKKSASNSLDSDDSESSAEQRDADPPKATVLGGRQAVRQRYIQQKRLASMNPQAMKEIFMLSAAG